MKELAAARELTTKTEKTRIAIQDQLSNLTKDRDQLQAIIQDLESEKEALSTRLRSDADKISRLELALSGKKLHEANDTRKVKSIS
jgi:cell division protein FtsB